jgi:hypothetical protein
MSTHHSLYLASGTALSLVPRLGSAFRISAAPLRSGAAEILQHAKSILGTLSVVTYDNPERGSGRSY